LWNGNPAWADTATPAQACRLTAQHCPQSGQHQIATDTSHQHRVQNLFFHNQSEPSMLYDLNDDSSG